MRKRAPLENRRSTTGQQGAPPSLESRKMEKPGSRFESTTRKRPHKQPRLCKHCAVSAQRRSYRSSLWSFFAESLEARIIPKRIENRDRARVAWSERDVSSQCASVRDLQSPATFESARFVR